MARKQGSAAQGLRRPWNPPPARTAKAARATFHLPADLLDQVRDTVVALSGPPAQLTMSKFAEHALRRELERLQNERGGSERGKPFSGRHGPVRRGRPLL